MLLFLLTACCGAYHYPATETRTFSCDEVASDGLSDEECELLCEDVGLDDVETWHCSVLSDCTDGDASTPAVKARCNGTVEEACE